MFGWVQFHPHSSDLILNPAQTDQTQGPGEENYPPLLWSAPGENSPLLLWSARRKENPNLLVL